MNALIATAIALVGIFLAAAWMESAQQETRAEFFRSCALNGGLPIWTGPACEKPREWDQK